MQIVPYSKESLAEAITIITSGGVIAHATETCYGFACDLRNVDAVKKLFAIKKRSESQPISGLFISTDDAKKYVTWNTRADELAAKYLPGPLTMILPLRPDAPAILLPIPGPNPNPTIGIRISSHPHAQEIAATIGFPISTTSANLHGQPNPYSAVDITKQFAAQALQPDLVLDNGVLPQVPPSTVIDLTKEEMEEKRKGGLHLR